MLNDPAIVNSELATTRSIISLLGELLFEARIEGIVNRVRVG